MRVKKTDEQKEFEKFFLANAPEYALPKMSKYPWNHRYNNGNYSWAYVHVGFICWKGALENERNRR